MSALLLRTSCGAARTWTRLYTVGARPAARDARREQIAGDLWDHHADALAEGATSGALAAEVASRVLRGVPADLAWRLRTGGIEMRSTFVIERSSGLVMVLLALLIAGTLSRPGISGEEPYFSSDFPDFARNLDSVLRATLFQFALGVATFGAAVLLYLTFRPHSRLGAAVGALALVVAGVLFIAGAVAGLQLHALAEDWREAGSVRGDAIWLDARDAAERVESLGFLAFIAVASSFASFGVVIARSAALPRALGWPALVGGATAVGSIPLWAIGLTADAAWLVTMLGLLGVAASFLLTAGWLTIRGTRRPNAPTSPAT